jgi:hypothetical protein
MRFIKRAVITIAAVLTASVAAAQDRALPEFIVRNSADQEVASTVMSVQPKWLLVYVSPDCRPCNTLMRALPKWQSAELMVRVVLVVAAKHADAKAWIEKSLPPEMHGLTWYADPERQAGRALELTGAPVLVGVRNGILEWQLGGVLNSPSALESVVRSWVEDKK